MSYFINYLRVIATILITNSHYSEIWPVSAMAAGGMLGNILFFAASGFCLYNIKEKFPKWYAKRFLRIYPSMIVFTLTAILFGKYTINLGVDFIKLFIYPTNYPFLVWLMVSYIGFYILASLDKKYKKTIEIAFPSLIVLWLAVYLVFVDKTTCHIDDVTKPFILFLYFSSMLMGACFKKYVSRFEKLKWYNVALLFGSLIFYFGSKIAFERWQSIAPLQIFNQFSILVTLYFFFAVFIGLEKYFKNTGKTFNEIIKFIAGITLQIYIVQFLIIYKWQNLMFPLNFLVVTCAILIAAAALYYVEFFIRKGIGWIVNKTKKGNNNAESTN